MHGVYTTRRVPMNLQIHPILPIAADSLCYPNNVIGPGSPPYDDAYFEISHTLAYTTSATGPISTAAVGGTACPTGSSKSGTSAAAIVETHPFNLSMLVILLGALLGC
ncbi:glycoside hydrolase family 16 protein [Sphaerobolus stellatus SS14]|uniref:Glycoside hydrolase family 16 protein n=1 Tax=Sphaerobolus stellatus (strain SS14) TaxID=990650 RepID=A0A0C9TKZ5_SPHS4|nr:glycoside hydrolase family 16 protein [Sphaerobolus stellatus SS14]